LKDFLAWFGAEKEEFDAEYIPMAAAVQKIPLSSSPAIGWGERIGQLNGAVTKRSDCALWKPSTLSTSAGPLAIRRCNM
jgi:hypothetical protein